MIPTAINNLSTNKVPYSQSILNNTDMTSSIQTPPILPPPAPPAQSPAPPKTHPSYSGTYASPPNDAGYLSTHYIETPPESPDLQLTWQYGKTIKCISVIDLFFIFLNSLIAWPLSIFAIFPVCGYYGSKRYEVNKTIVYLIYCILRTISIVVQLGYSFKNNTPDDDSSGVNRRLHSDASQLFLFFSIFVQMWITWIVFRFITKLRNLSKIQINTLIIGTFIPVQTQVLIW